METDLHGNIDWYTDHNCDDEFWTQVTDCMETDPDSNIQTGILMQITTVRDESRIQVMDIAQTTWRQTCRVT